ncbi:cell division protein FtsZ [Candidatus Wolfebacteria bacterium]|nr:cell division protein FtsZ [Candidatus Wolfebacteria bacterium]
MPKKSKDNEYTAAKIKVVGIGGAGGNAISRMHNDFPRGVELIAINTDIQDLIYTSARKKIHIGKNLTKGLGTGMNPDLGRQAAEENRSEIAEALKGADMVFITAGEGGGTGTGAAPVVAETAKELGILTVAIVTKPFSFEGAQRGRLAQEGILKLKDRVDTLITIPNDRIFSLIDKDTSLIRAFEEIDEILKNAVQGVTELIMSPGIVNVDFADVKAIMADAGSAIIGIGIASGQERSVNAANAAVNSPLLETSIDGAKGVLFSVSGHRDLKMNEINDVAKLIAENVDQSAKIIFGTYHDRRLKKGQLKVTLVATGFNGGLTKSGVLLNSLFNAETVNKPAVALFSENVILENKEEKNIFEEKETAKDETIFNKKTGPVKSIKKEKEGVWDIPTFLRKKKR